MTRVNLNFSFKMYITINDIIGEKTTYSIDSTTGWRTSASMEITVISMISDNTQYEIKEPLDLKLMGNDEKRIPNGTYTMRELSTFVERKMILTNLDRDSRVIKMEKFTKITNLIFNLDELDNSNNLEDGRPSNTFFTYYVTSYNEFTHFEPRTPQYKKFKNGQTTSLTLRIMDQNDKIITNGPRTTVVLHIRDRKI